MYQIACKSLSILLIAAFLLGCEPAPNEPYIRIKNRQLQVASKSFVPLDKAGPKVTLLGVVHFGEAQYYQTIQRRLDKADRVLFERIGTQEEEQALSKELERDCPENKLPKEEPFEKLAKSLKLELQINQIQYDRPHFVHADMTLMEFAWASSNKSGQSICQIVEANKWAHDSGKSELTKLGTKVSRNLTALILVKKIESTREQVEGAQRVMLFDRNDIVVSKLRQQLPAFSAEHEVIVFYGALHMKDIEKSLIEMNYRLDRSEWLSAFSLDEKN